MDIILYVVAGLSIGIYKAWISGGFKVEEKISVTNEDGTTQLVPRSSIPVGNNLLLEKEPEAFTLILKELGLF